MQDRSPGVDLWGSPPQRANGFPSSVVTNVRHLCGTSRNYVISFLHSLSSGLRAVLHSYLKLNDAIYESGVRGDSRICNV